MVSIYVKFFIVSFLDLWTDLCEAYVILVLSLPQTKSKMKMEEVGPCQGIHYGD